MDNDKQYGFQAAEEPKKKKIDVVERTATAGLAESTKLAGMKQQLQAIVDRDKANRLAREAASEAAAQRHAEIERNLQAQYQAAPEVPSAAEIATRRAEQAKRVEAEAEEEQHETPVMLEDGSVVLVDKPEEKLDVFVRVKTPELQIIVDNGQEFEVLTGRFLYSYRVRKPEDGNRVEVPGLPKPRALREPEKAELPSWNAYRSQVVNFGADESSHQRIMRQSTQRSNRSWGRPVSDDALFTN